MMSCLFYTAGEAATMSGYQISAFAWGPTDQSLYATYYILVLAAGNFHFGPHCTRPQKCVLK